MCIRGLSFCKTGNLEKGKSILKDGIPAGAIKD